MSETKRVTCKHCGEPIAKRGLDWAHEKYGYRCYAGGVENRWYPAEPVIEVPPGEQTLENGGLTQDDAWNIVYGVEKTDPVPAQEAPREPGRKCIDCDGTGLVWASFDITVACTRCSGSGVEPAEPQAGAQELFPGANDMRAPTGMENLRDTPPIVYEGNMAFAQFVGVIEEAERAGAQSECPGCQFVNRNHLYSCPARHRVKPQAGAPKCKYGNPLCPCQDGDPCHYEGDNPMKPQAGAQEAPRVNCTCESPCHLDCTDSSCGCLHHARNKAAEPQAGAQVPSQNYREMWQKAVDHGLAQHIIKVRENTKLREELGRAESHLNSIKSYATEAAKTPITRELLKDATDLEALRLLAYSQFDEMQGLCRLILSESGGSK